MNDWKFNNDTRIPLTLVAKTKKIPWLLIKYVTKDFF